VCAASRKITRNDVAGTKVRSWMKVAWAKNRTKSKVRAKVEHVFQVMKLKFGFVKSALSGAEEERAPPVCHLCPGEPVYEPPENCWRHRLAVSSVWPNADGREPNPSARKVLSTAGLL